VSLRHIIRGRLLFFALLAGVWYAFFGSVVRSLGYALSVVVVVEAVNRWEGRRRRARARS
jgi:hypothetical protein